MYAKKEMETIGFIYKELVKMVLHKAPTVPILMEHFDVGYDLRAHVVQYPFAFTEAFNKLGKTKKRLGFTICILTDVKSRNVVGLGYAICSGSEKEFNYREGQKIALLNSVKYAASRDFYNMMDAMYQVSLKPEEQLRKDYKPIRLSPSEKDLFLNIFK